MPIYISMLRGINVGAHKRMKMEKLRASCEALGFEQVKTFIQSGNVIFEAQKVSPSTMSEKIEKRILGDFGFSVDVISRTREEFAEIIRNNPLLKEKGVDPSMLHVAFLWDAPEPAALKKLESLTQPPDRVRWSRKEIYLYFPNGVSGSSLWKHPFDRVLSVTSTMRNWNTVNQLCDIAAGLESCG